MIFKCLESSIALNYFRILFHSKVGQCNGQFSHQWVNTEQKASLTLNSIILAGAKLQWIGKKIRVNAIDLSGKVTVDRKKN